MTSISAPTKTLTLPLTKADFENGFTQPWASEKAKEKAEEVLATMAAAVASAENAKPEVGTITGEASSGSVASKVGTIIGAASSGSVAPPDEGHASVPDGAAQREAGQV